MKRSHLKNFYFFLALLAFSKTALADIHSYNPFELSVDKTFTHLEQKPGSSLGWKAFAVRRHGQAVIWFYHKNYAAVHGYVEAAREQHKLLKIDDSTTRAHGEHFFVPGQESSVEATFQIIKQNVPYVWKTFDVSEVSVKKNFLTYELTFGKNVDWETLSLSGVTFRLPSQLADDIQQLILQAKIKDEQVSLNMTALLDISTYYRYCRLSRIAKIL